MVHKLYLQHTLAECRTQERKISCKQERGITKLSLSVSTEARALPAEELRVGPTQRKQE